MRQRLIPSLPPLKGDEIGEGRNYYSIELVSIFKTMEEILLIGPDKWEKVVELHLFEFPGCDVDCLRRKYTYIHRKKVPTGDLNMPEEVRLAKKFKYMIGDQVQLEGGGVT